MSEGDAPSMTTGAASEARPEGPTDASAEPVCAVVAAHGDLAAGLVSAVAQITGRGSVFVPLSNRGMGAEQLEETLRAALARTGARLVFTDLPGGSWTITARRLQRADASFVLVTGVNLVMLLDCVFHEDGPVGETARAAVERARSGMTVAGGAP